MSFAEPIWLYLTPILLLLFVSILAYGFRKRDALLGRFAASRLLDQLTEKAGLTRTWIKAGCVILAIVAIGIAFARPQLGVEFSERKARGLDIVFVLDSSKSMLATDMRPTRLERAKLAIIDLVERLESDRIGLIAFAGQAFLQTPPTLDYAAFRESLEAIDPNIMTSGGSDLGNALKEASEAFPSKNNIKVVVLLTDGEDLGGNALAAAEEARKEGIQTFAIGIGTPEGEYLKIRNDQGIEEFLRDASGQPVRSQLDEATLQQIAQITGGTYSRLSGHSLDRLYHTVLATLPREERESELQEIKIERFQWALSGALIFLVLEILIRRRRNAAIHASLAIFALLSICPTDAQAQTEGAPDARSLYNSAYETLNAGEYENAATLYESALAQTNDLKLQSDALYNMGHATYQQGRATYESGDPQTALEQMKKAESLFNSAQEIDLTDTSIKSDLEQVSQVRAAIQELIEQQQEQEQPESDDQSKEPEDSEENQPGQQGEDSQQEQDEQQGDQQQDENQDGSAGEESESSDEPPDQEAAGEESQDTPQESTEDPVDDIPQPQPGEESEEPGEESEQGSAPEPTEGEESAGQTGTGDITGEPIEGMTELDAAALLDSLRGKETLLPFIDQQRSGRNRDTRDW
jgi:Ca-activated chloride channel family protein